MRHLPTVLQFIGLVVLVVAGFYVSTLIGVFAAGAAALFVGVVLEKEIT